MEATATLSRSTARGVGGLTNRHWWYRTIFVTCRTRPTGEPSQRSDSSASSLAADGHLTNRAGRPTGPPTLNPSQTGAAGQPLRATRTLKKEDTLMLIATTQRTSAD